MSTTSRFTANAHVQHRSRGMDPRPASPAQLALVGLGVWILGALVPALGVLVPVGIILLVGAGLGQLLRPRKRTMYWRGRNIELDGEPTPATRLYHVVFKS